MRSGPPTLASSRPCVLPGPLTVWSQLGAPMPPAPTTGDEDGRRLVGTSHIPLLEGPKSCPADGMGSHGAARAACPHRPAKRDNAADGQGWSAAPRITPPGSSSTHFTRRGQGCAAAPAEPIRALVARPRARETGQGYLGPGPASVLHSFASSSTRRARRAEEPSRDDPSCPLRQRSRSDPQKWKENGRRGARARRARKRGRISGP